MLNNVCCQISEDAYGANGDLSRSERIDRCAQQLVDFVYEVLGEDDVSFWRDCKDRETAERAYRAVERLVAIAMIGQFEYDEKVAGDMLATACSAAPATALRR
jgi:hypothetical protein